MVALLRRTFVWVLGHEFTVLAAALTVVGGTWGFIELADEVFEGDTQTFDEWALRALRDPQDPGRAWGPPWLAEVGRDATALGGVAVLSFMTLAVAGFLLIHRKYRSMWLVIGACFGGMIFSSTLKALFQRPRPDLVPHLSHVYTTSFPSGHSLMSAVVYLTLGALLVRLVPDRKLKIYLLTLALLLTAAVGVSRVYMGVHYPTDVLGGWTAGIVWAMLCWLAARYLQKRGAVTTDATEEGTDAATSHPAQV